MKPVLYRYKDTESVVRAMDGYTPGEGWTPLFEAPATAPEKTVKEIMEFVRHYATNTFSSATLEDKIRRSLTAPATAPAWNNVPTCEGLWLCDEGDENPYRFTCHDISMPLNPHLVGEGERWYGPIPEDK